jgi:hypothetical protein
VRAPGLEVTITGEPELVKQVLEAVKAELAQKRRPRDDARPRPALGPAVRPTALDELDSPYAIPQHRPHEKPAESQARAAPGVDDTPPPQAALRPRDSAVPTGAFERTDTGSGPDWVEGSDAVVPIHALRAIDASEPRRNESHLIANVRLPEVQPLTARGEGARAAARVEPRTLTSGALLDPEGLEATGVPGIDFVSEATIDADHLIESDEPPNEPTAVDVMPSGTAPLPATLLPRVTEVQRQGRVPTVAGRPSGDDE